MQRALLTETQVADWLGLSPKWLQQQRWRGKGIPYHKVGGAVRYDPCDVEQYIQKSRRDPQQGEAVA